MKVENIANNHLTPNGNITNRDNQDQKSGKSSKTYGKSFNVYLKFASSMMWEVRKIYQMPLEDVTLCLTYFQDLTENVQIELNVCFVAKIKKMFKILKGWGSIYKILRMMMMMIPEMSIPMTSPGLLIRVQHVCHEHDGDNSDDVTPHNLDKVYDHSDKHTPNSSLFSSLHH